MLALLAVAAPICSAQDRPVQQGVADVDPLLESLRAYSPSLRLDNNFEHVYLLDANDPNSPFFRRAGGLYAVFPRSEYVLTRDGVIAAVPPGTIFHFGRPETESTTANAPRNSAPLSVDRLRDTGASDQRHIGRQAPTPIVTNRLDRSAGASRQPDTESRSTPVEQLLPAKSAQGVMSDAQYRARRLAQIVARHAPRG